MCMESKDEINEALKHWINRSYQRAKSENGLLKKTLAEECGVSEQAINKWFKTGNIDKKHFYKLTQLLGPMADIIGLTPAEYAAEKIKKAGFTVTKAADKAIVLDLSHIMLPVQSPDLIITKPGTDYQAYLEIHPVKRFGIPMHPKSTKSFIFIPEDKIGQAAQIVTDHYKAHQENAHEPDKRAIVSEAAADYTAGPAQYKIPVLDMIQAGQFKDIEYDGTPIGYDLVTQDLSHCFALKVINDSMTPTLSEGALVYVQPQPTAQSGDIVIAQVNGDTQATIKRLRRDGSQTYLVPDNIKYDPIKITEDLQCRIIGVVISARIDFKK